MTNENNKTSAGLHGLNRSEGRPRREGDPAAQEAGKDGCPGKVVKKQRKDWTGERFGMLTVLSESDSRRLPSGGVQRRVMVACGCGTTKCIFLSSLLYSGVISCGCVRTRKASERATTHGMSGTPVYHVWAAMIQRCCNPTNPAWGNYGGRGITVCSRWRNSFKAFLQDMGHPESGMTIERVDNNSGYCRENCVWANRRQQANNLRRNRIITHLGISCTVAEWARRCGIHINTLTHRLNGGMPPSEALGTPVNKKFANQKMK